MRCHWPGCRIEISPREWACRRHWLTLPHIFREQLVQTYSPRRRHPDYADLEEVVHRWAIAYEMARADQEAMRQ